LPYPCVLIEDHWDVARGDGEVGQHDGKDLLDRTVTFENGQQWKDVEIVLTDKRTELTLQVADEQGAPTRDYVALVFSTDKTRWELNPSRYVRPYVPLVSSAGSAGLGSTTTSFSVIGGVAGSTFTTSATTVVPSPGGSTAKPGTITGMPAGDYYVVALDDIDGESVRDPDLLEQLSRGASRVTLNEAMPTQVSLRRVKLASVVGAR